jgi:hypothetical protein
VCLQDSQFSRLPQTLLIRILQLLPQRERLTSCALVCKSWAEAAAAATVEVDVPAVARAEHTHERIAAFQPWLEQHAGQLVSLRVPQPVDSWTWTNSVKRPFLHLPSCQLQQLSRLELERLEVCLKPTASSSSTSSGGSYTATVPMLAKLQELRLHMCKYSRSTLLQLAQLSGVTKLVLNESREMSDGPFSHPEAVKHLLQGLPNLEHLRLQGPVEASDIVPDLPAHTLTALTLYQHNAKLPDSASRLVNLRELKLSAELSPVALASMTLLTELVLFDCNSAASVLGNDTTDCLAALRGMSQLQVLQVSDSFGALLQAAEPHACAALTASSQLTYLEISAELGQLLPATALQHMFPAGKQLPQLQRLLFHCANRERDEGCITTAELSSLVRACPGLECLSLTCAVAADADISTLLKLPQQCQHLAVGGQAFGDKAAGVVAQMTQLKSLEWAHSPGLTYAGLAQLTALHALDGLLTDYNSQCVTLSLGLSQKAGGQVRSNQLPY